MKSVTMYCASRFCWAALYAKELPRSRTSGARSLSLLLREVTALISSWLAPSGFSTLTLMPYFFSKPSISLS